MIIGITGTDGAGKGTVVEYLIKEKGFIHYSARKLYLREVEKRGLGRSRANMRIVANDFRAKFGNNYLVAEYLKRAKDEGSKNSIIESIRATAEAETLKDNRGMLLAVDADQKVRYERISKRASESDHISFEEFIEHEKLEMDDPDPHGMQKAKVMEMADYTLTNNNSVEELYKKVEIVLQKIGLQTTG